MNLTRPMPILMYHRIAPMNRQSTVRGHYVHPQAFARQMRLLKLLGYESADLSLDTAVGKPVAITFDDGYENFYTGALPALVANGYRSTVFLVASLIGKTNEWDEARGDVCEPLMNVEMIRSAAQQGTSFGSHTLTHADLSVVDTEEAWCQIADSRAVLESMLGNEVSAFCYPYGRKTPDVVAMVENAGYRLACSTEKGMNTPDTNRYALRRINVRSDTSLPVFVYKLLRRGR